MKNEMSNPQVEKNEIDKNKLRNFVQEMQRIMSEYKEMPNVELGVDADGTYQSQDLQEVEQKRPNKYRKVYFASMINYLHLIIRDLPNSNTYLIQMQELQERIQQSERVTKEIIDDFDAFANDVISVTKDILDET